MAALLSSSQQQLLHFTPAQLTRLLWACAKFFGENMMLCVVSLYSSMLMDWPSKSICRFELVQEYIFEHLMSWKDVFFSLALNSKMMNVEYETLFSDVLWMIMVYKMVLWKVSAFTLIPWYTYGIKKTLPETNSSSHLKMDGCNRGFNEGQVKTFWRQESLGFFGFICILFCWQMLFWRILI